MISHLPGKVGRMACSKKQVRERGVMKPSESVVSIAAIAVMALPSQAAAQKAAAAASREPSTVEVKQAPLNSGFEDIEIGENTSELPSLMRISYPVFCLKQKHTQNHA